MIIAIDGPSGSGKSTTAKILAQRLKITHLDTGAMYRVVTWGLIRKNINIRDLEKVKTFLEEVKITYSNSNNIFLDGELVSSDIRKNEVTSNVSAVSSINEVRNFLVKIQRDIGMNIDCVIEGRDIGSVVFPDADFKFYLTADLDIRAKRRKNELEKIGENFSLDEIRSAIQERDMLDSSRELSPLKRTKDAIEINSTNLTIDQQLDKLMYIIKQNK